MTSFIAKTLSFSVLMFVLLGSIRAEDQIIRKTSAAPLRVERVTAETYEEVSYRQRGVSSEKKLSADKVREVIYGDQPAAYTQGIRFLEKMDFENAIASLKLSMEGSGVRDWVKTYARLHMGRAYQLWGASDKSKFQEAINTYNDLLADDPKTRFYAEVLLNMALAHSSNGDLSNAVATFERLGKEAYEKKLGVVWEARAKHEKAEAKLLAGQLDESERDFKSSETFCTEQAKKTDDVVLKAELDRLAGLDRLSQGKVLIKRKRYKQAQDFFKGVLSNSSSTLEAMAGAQNGLAECFLAEKKVKEAQNQFAIARVVYGAVSVEAAKATYYLGICCLELKEKEPKYKMMAQTYFQEVVTLFPATFWAKEAQKKLK